MPRSPDLLVPVPDRAAVVACSTCRHSADAPDDPAGVRGGARLAEHLRTAAKNANIAVEGMPCLFACGAHCVVHLRAPGKIGYVLGRFTPDADAARAIIDFARAYAASAEGEVPYGQWPEEVKGRFLVRTPPPGFLAV